MFYKEIMDPYPRVNIIRNKTTLKESLSIMQSKGLDILIVGDEEKVSGIITKDALLAAFSNGISIQDTIGSVVDHSYGTKNESEEIQEGIFSNGSTVIILDHNLDVAGIISPEILSKNLLKLSIVEMKKNITTKNILHPKGTDNDQGTVDQDDSDYFLDFYNRINRLIYINKELWDIIEYSSDSIYVTDGKGVTVYVNDSFERITGAPVSSVLGKTVFEAESAGIYHPSISAIVLREKRQVTLLQRGSNGKDIVVTGTPVFDNEGNIYMVICNSKDIDELSVLKNYLLDIKSSTMKTLTGGGSKRSDVIYTSNIMINTMKLVNKVAHVDSTVMLTGESGTGKGLIARYIHENSRRADGKMVEINCSAIPESLLESELFGYESGAFTGAQKGGKAGIIEMADKGTLFLDEIGDMPMHMQVKLLKVLQDRQVTRVGALAPVDVDVRLIAATNKDLKQLIEKDLFRADLYYRLNVFPIHIAPLRERKEDIHTLLQHFLKQYNLKNNNDVVLTQKAQEKIANYDWPGNVRELEHYIERLVIMKEGTVDWDDLEIECGFETDKTSVKVNNLMPLKEAVDETERQLIHLAMKISQNSYDVADLLEISQASAHRKIKKYT